MDRFQEEPICFSRRGRDEDGHPEEVEVALDIVADEEEPCEVIRAIYSISSRTSVWQMVDAAEAHRAGPCLACHGIRKPIGDILSEGRAA
jgi:hypothetical protein